MRCEVMLTHSDFGHHNYDLKADPQPGHEKGKHHTEFAPA